MQGWKEPTTRPHGSKLPVGYALGLTTVPLVPRLIGQILYPNQNVFVHTFSKIFFHSAMSRKKYINKILSYIDTYQVTYIPMSRNLNFRSFLWEKYVNRRMMLHYNTIKATYTSAQLKICQYKVQQFV